MAYDRASGAAFVLRDHSRNGIFVTVAGRGEVCIQDEELLLGNS